MRPVTSRPATRAARLLLLGLVAGGLGCATAGPPPSIEELAGCYFFEQDDEARALRLPDGIHLTPRPLEGWPAIMQRGGVKVAVTLTDQGPADYPFGYWLLEDDGALEVGYPAGGGIVLHLEGTTDRLEGTARTFGDTFSYPDEDAGAREVPVTLMRGRCPE